MVAVSKLLDLRPILPRKNKPQAYQCSNCGNDAIAEALFETEHTSVIVRLRLCEPCSSSASHLITVVTGLEDLSNTEKRD